MTIDMHSQLHKFPQYGARLAFGKSETIAETGQNDLFEKASREYRAMKYTLQTVVADKQSKYTLLYLGKRHKLECFPGTVMFYRLQVPRGTPSPLKLHILPAKGLYHMMGQALPTELSKGIKAADLKVSYSNEPPGH